MRIPLRRRARPPRTPDARMPVMEHLIELRRRIVISAVAVVLGGIVAFVFSNQIIEFLVTYYKDATHGQKDALVFTGPADAFLTRLKVATYGGIVLALPVWLYQLWRFVTPGLNPKERRYAVPFVASAILLFAFGAFVAFQTLEPALRFLIDVGGSAQQPLFTADRYLTLVSLMIVAFGVSFEFPVVLVFLLLARVLTTARLRKWRRGAIVFIVAFAAVITPSQDPYSLFFMAVPMYLFYEASIVVGRILKR
jgi:sec-independent protein translocase protein TatC